MVPFGQPVSLGDPPAAAFAALGRAYITCLRDRAIPPAMQRRMFEAAGCDPVIEIDTDHAPWISRTDELVAALDRLAGGRLATAGRPLVKRSVIESARRVPRDAASLRTVGIGWSAS